MCMKLFTYGLIVGVVLASTYATAGSSTLILSNKNDKSVNYFIKAEGDASYYRYMDYSSTKGAIQSNNATNLRLTYNGSQDSSDKKMVGILTLVDKQRACEYTLSVVTTKGFDIQTRSGKSDCPNYQSFINYNAGDKLEWQ